MQMSVERFFELFLNELKQHETLRGYYKFLEDEKSFEFRKSYFCQRLEYIYTHVPKNEPAIWDCGCGYGTTALFLAMNGVPVYGNTLEFYFKEIPQRLAYWNQFGNANLFTSSYDDLFDMSVPSEKYDCIIVQDTLHHIEPIADGLALFGKVLKKNGTFIGIEENGSNLIQTFKLYLQRGNKRIITFHDEKLNRDILMGNENIRSLEHWTQLFKDAGMNVVYDKTEFIRLFLPFMLRLGDARNLLSKEKSIWRSNGFLKKYFYFGINFVANK